MLTPWRAEDRADLADDAGLVGVAACTIIVPSSGASIADAVDRTSRGVVRSNTAPSTQRSPSLVCSFTEIRLV